MLGIGINLGSAISVSASSAKSSSSIALVLQPLLDLHDFDPELVVKDRFKCYILLTRYGLTGDQQNQVLMHTNGKCDSEEIEVEQVQETNETVEEEPEEPEEPE